MTGLYASHGFVLVLEDSVGEMCCEMRCSSPSVCSVAMVDNHHSISTSWPTCAMHMESVRDTLIKIQAVPVGGLESYPVGLS